MICRYLTLVLVAVCSGLVSCGGYAESPDETQDAEPSETPKDEEAPRFRTTLDDIEKAKPKWHETKAGESLTLDDGIVISDLIVGDGTRAIVGANIRAHVTGWIKSNGAQFWSTLDKNEPLKALVQKGKLIDGWVRGIPGARAGGKRRLEIPSALAYGARGHPEFKIPPHADLIFEIEVLAVY